jgi:hypothetical protein
MPGQAINEGRLGIVFSIPPDISDQVGRIHINANGIHLFVSKPSNKLLLGVADLVRRRSNLVMRGR